MVKKVSADGLLPSVLALLNFIALPDKVFPKDFQRILWPRNGSSSVNLHLVYPGELCETYCSLAISFNPSSKYGVIFSFRYIRAGAPPATLGRTLSSPATFPPVVAGAVDEL